MIKFKIDNIEYESPEGSTILNIARKAGLFIPTLCHNDDLPHFSSCMACMVKDNKTNRYIPSCSALVQDGMDIDLSGEEVILLRRKAIELLLSEHRAECEAPCKVVCPAGYNIPLLNRLLAARDFEKAHSLLKQEITSSGIACIKCPGYCENACRRKKIDQPVSIRNIQLFIAQSINLINPVQDNTDDNPGNVESDGITRVSGKLSHRFSSRIGRLEETELKEWLKECSGTGTRHVEIADEGSAAGEAENCMHCDCRGADNCRLRDIAEEFSIKDPKGKIVNSPIEKKINHNTGLIFENAKCIKCGLCVRLSERLKEEPALCFINRGLISIISEPLTEEFDNVLKTISREVIQICPTGALSQIK